MDRIRARPGAPISPGKHDVRLRQARKDLAGAGFSFHRVDGRQGRQGPEAGEGSLYFSRIPSRAGSGVHPHAIALSQYTIASWNSPRV